MRSGSKLSLTADTRTFLSNIIDQNASSFILVISTTKNSISDRRGNELPVNIKAKAHGFIVAPSPQTEHNSVSWHLFFMLCIQNFSGVVLFDLESRISSPTFYKLSTIISLKVSKNMWYLSLK